MKLLRVGQLDSVVVDAAAYAPSGEFLDGKEIIVRFWKAVETVYYYKIQARIF